MGVGVPLAQEDALRSERIQKHPIDAVRPPLPILARLTVARTRRSIKIVRPGHLYSRERHLKGDSRKRGLIALALGRRPPRRRARPPTLRELSAPPRGFTWACSSRVGF